MAGASCLESACSLPVYEVRCLTTSQSLTSAAKEHVLYLGDKGGRTCDWSSLFICMLCEDVCEMCLDDDDGGGKKLYL